MKELKEGNIIYRCYHGKVTNKLIVNRVTKTQAICENQHPNYKFEKQYNDTSII